MMWEPNITTQQEINDLVEVLFATAPEVMGIDEVIAGCQVIDLDPFGAGVGTVPRYIRVALRDQYYQNVYYRGGITGLAVTDYVTVIHLRDGNRYEVLGPGGSTGGVPNPPPTPANQGEAIVSDAALQWTATLTPTWLGSHTFDAGLVVGAGQGITLPDPGWIGLGPASPRLTMTSGVPNIATFDDFGNVGIENVLFHIGDTDTYMVFSPDFCGFRVGNVDMLQMDENGVDIVEVNPTGADVDFNVQAVGVADALSVDGATGQVTLGALGAGIVQSTAGGVLSSSYTVTIPDDTADALHISDAGGIEYLKFITTDAQPIVRFNDGGVDIDFEVEAVGVADALQVRGSDGQITLGALGAGIVQSTAGGVLSSDYVIDDTLTMDGGDILPTDASGQSLGGLGNRWDLCTQEVYFNGATGLNYIIVPDNLADALHLSDAGGIEYLKIVTTNAQPAVVWNEGGVDVDFRVEGIGSANALFIQGSDSHVGINVVPSWRFQVFDQDTAGTIDWYTGTRLELERTVADAVANRNIRSVYARLEHSSAGLLYSARAMDARVINSSTGTIHEATAQSNRVVNTAAGTVTYARAFYGSLQNSVAGATITTGQTIFISCPYNAGTLTNNYGIYVEDQTAGTNNYGLYIEGASTYAIYVRDNDPCYWGGPFIVVDNTADAWHLSDAGGLEYWRIVSTDAQPAVVFNNGGADVDFRVAASGIANAFSVDGATGHLAMGVAPLAANIFTIEYAAINTTATFYGARYTFVKTAGATDELDGFTSVRSRMTINHDAVTHGTVIGIYAEGELDAGIIGTATTNRDLMGARNEARQDGGTIHGSMRGIYIRVDQNAGTTDNIYGAYIDVDADGTVTGNTYMLYLYERNNVDYGIYQTGAAINHLGGSTSIGGTIAPTAQLHVDQSSATGAIPVLVLNQADVDQPFIEFQSGTLYSGKTGQDEYVMVKNQAGNIRYLRLYA